MCVEGEGRVQVQSQGGLEIGPAPCSPGGTRLRRMKMSEPHWHLSVWTGGSQGYRAQGWSIVSLAAQAAAEPTQCANLGARMGASWDRDKIRGSREKGYSRSRQHSAYSHLFGHLG